MPAAAGRRPGADVFLRPEASGLGRSLPQQRCRHTALPRARRRNALRAAAHGDCCLPQPRHAHAKLRSAARQLQENGVTRRAVHLGTSQDAGARYSYFYEQTVVALAPPRERSFCSIPGLPTRPPCAGGCTGFGPSFHGSNAPAVVGESARDRAPPRGSQSQQRGKRVSPMNKPQAPSTKNGSAANSTQSPEIVGERDAAVELAPQDPVDHQSNGELRTRRREVVVQLRFVVAARLLPTAREPRPLRRPRRETVRAWLVAGTATASRGHGATRGGRSAARCDSTQQQF